MKRIDRSAIVEHSAAQIFALVEDIEAYPRFLPWCVAATVDERGPAGGGRRPRGNLSPAGGGPERGATRPRRYLHQSFTARWVRSISFARSSSPIKTRSPAALVDEIRCPLCRVRKEACDCSQLTRFASASARSLAAFCSPSCRSCWRLRNAASGLRSFAASFFGAAAGADGPAGGLSGVACTPGGGGSP